MNYKGYLLCLTGIDVPCTVWIVSLICNINTNAAPVSDLCRVGPIILFCDDQHDIVSVCSACDYSENLVQEEC